MRERALSFGSSAADYERYRPGYPEVLVDEILGYAGAPVRTALEIGAGTGKATRVFAARGIPVTATEPDAGMLEELRRHVPASVVTLRAAFEEIHSLPPVDLVFAAASLHWTDPEGRWERIAAMLADGGTFASFGGQMHLADGEVERAVRAARSPWLEDDDVPSPDGTPAGSPMQWPGTEMLRSGLFADVRQVTIGRRATMTAREYIGHLSTISAYRVLPEAARCRAFENILRALPARVELVADVVLHLARKA